MELRSLSSWQTSLPTGQCASLAPPPTRHTLCLLSTILPLAPLGVFVEIQTLRQPICIRDELLAGAIGDNANNTDVFLAFVMPQALF